MLTGLIVPFTLKPLSLYHVPMVGLAAGLSLAVAARRIVILLLPALGLVLGFCPPLLGVTPMVWAAVSVLFAAILAGIGLQGLAWAGWNDRSWILLPVAVSAVLTATTWILGLRYEPRTLYHEAAMWHLLGLAMTAIILFLARMRVRYHELRWVLLVSAVGLDVLWGARYVLSKAM